MAVSKKCVIPSRPEVFLQFTHLIKEKNPDINAICAALKRDVALFSAVLAAVNSPYLGLVQKITSLEHAVSLLGINRVFSIVRLTALRNSLSEIGRLDRFWDTSEDVAYICSVLSRRFSNINEDDAYTIGMLHDCGIPLMMGNFGDFKSFLSNIKGENISLLHGAEMEAFGSSHYNLGFQVASEWNFPKGLCSAILEQPNYSSFLRDTCEEKLQSRMLLSILLRSKEVSRKYRTYWRVNQPDIPIISDMEVPLNVLAISEADFIEFRDEILLKMQA
ncbi:HDOD domain-containing protein [Pontibacterium sp.]|uniref:HDOD domain-containing protein n=1 Tax=Pontibacterium sp. TaxID=2036026 RepID=UPI003563EB59